MKCKWWQIDCSICPYETPGEFPGEELTCSRYEDDDSEDYSVTPVEVWECVEEEGIFLGRRENNGETYTTI